MSKILYSQSTNSVVPYPRKDDQPVIGLHPDYLVLDVVEDPQPFYDSKTQYLTSSQVIELEHLKYRKKWVVEDYPSPPLPPPPAPAVRWDDFNAYMLTDVTFKGYRNTVAAVDKDLTSALYDAYSLIEAKGVSAFGLLWGVWCQVSGITAEHKEAIAFVAHQCNLPAEFIAVLRR